MVSPEPLANALAAEAVSAFRLHGVAQHEQTDRTLVLVVSFRNELAVPALSRLARVRLQVG